MTEQLLPYRERDLALSVEKAKKTLPVVAVTGLRQAGKTTFLKEDPVFAEYRYRTLDDLATLEAAREDPDRLVSGDKPLLIDEAQRLPELFLAIKRAVDQRREPGRFVLSGSANLNLLEGITESLAGRALYLRLHPFTRRERLGIRSAPFLPSFFEAPQLPSAWRPSAMTELGGPIEDDEILDGGMPPVVTLDLDRRLWFLGYEQTYVERDVRQISQISDLVTFRNVLQLGALRTGQLANVSSLGRDAKVSASTAGRYLDLLETTFVIERLHPFLRSRGQRLVKTPKLFFADSGLAAHLCGVDDLYPPGGEPLRGHLFETWVFQNLRGIVDAFLPGFELGFWSIQGRTEVDFVLSYRRWSMAIEVKSGSTFRKSDLKGLREFLAKTDGAVAGVLAYNGDEAFDLGDRLYAVPLALLLS